jgi:hypothetical protein
MLDDKDKVLFMATALARLASCTDLASKSLASVVGGTVTSTIATHLKQETVMAYKALEVINKDIK